MENNKIIVYCDGGVRGNQFEKNIGAYGAILSFNGKEKIIGDVIENVTNNQMELLAAIEALKQIKSTKYPIEIISDSQYLVMGITEWVDVWLKNGWVNSKGEPVKNRELWNELYALCFSFQQKAGLTFTKCQGHSNNDGNNRVDAMLNELMDNYKPQEVRYAILDFETGGLDPKTSAICSVGIVVLDCNFNQIYGYYTLVKDNPERIIGQKALEVNGLKLEDIEQGKDIIDVVYEIGDIIEDCVMVCHNAAFDMAFLNARGFKINQAIDTLLLARTIWPDQKNNLGAVCNRLGIEVKDAHNSFGDALMTAEVLRQLSKKYPQKIVPTTINFGSKK